jgi:organic radical activating enzyme
MAKLEVSTVVGCRVACTYCPQKMHVSAYKSRKAGEHILSAAVFEKCCSKLPPNSEIIFSGFSEPFLNPECPRFLRYAHERGFIPSVFTTAVGIEKNTIDQIRAIPFKSFIVHLPDNCNTMNVEVNDAYFSVLDGLRNIIPNITFLLTKGQGMSDSFHPAVKDYLDKNKIQCFIHVKHSRAGAVQVTDAAVVPRMKGDLAYCPRLDINVLLPDGSVALCCQDFGQKHILGNLQESSFESLHQSDMFRFVVEGLTDSTKDLLCRECLLYARRKGIRGLIDSSKVMGLSMKVWALNAFHKGPVGSKPH